MQEKNELGNRPLLFLRSSEPAEEVYINYMLFKQIIIYKGNI